jgi:hypothetical protein
MSSIALQHPSIILKPLDVCLDLQRYGITAFLLDGTDDPAPQDGAEPPSCAVLEMPTEVIVREYPVNEPWCEIVPCHRPLPTPQTMTQGNYYDQAA